MRLRYPVRICSVLYVYRRKLNVRVDEVKLSEKQVKWFYDVLNYKFPSIRPIDNRYPLDYEFKEDSLILKFPKKGNLDFEAEMVAKLKFVLSEFLKDKDLAVAQAQGREQKVVKKMKEILFNPYMWYHSDVGLWYLWSVAHFLNINIAVVSNPGQGKSYLMKNFVEMNRNGRYIDLNTTIAGVLGEVVYDQATKSWVYNRMVYNDMVFYVDEFNLLKMEVRDALLSLMSGVLLVNKAGVSVQEKITLSFIVCQNPATEERVFKPDLPLKNQVTRIEPLYDRLHLIYPLIVDIESLRVELPKVKFFTKLINIDKLFNLQQIKVFEDVLLQQGLIDKKYDIYEWIKMLHRSYNGSLRPPQIAFALLTFNFFVFGIDFNHTKQMVNILLQWKYNESLTFEQITMERSGLTPEEFRNLAEEIYKRGKENFMRYYVQYYGKGGVRK